MTKFEKVVIGFSTISLLYIITLYIKALFTGAI